MFYFQGIDEVISCKIGNVYKKGISVLDEIKEKVCIMPLKKMIERLLMLPDFLKSMLQNIEALQSENKMKSLINGQRWKKIVKNYPEETIVIPIDIYTDDFESGNALGSNAGTHKITGFYFSFPTLPSHLLSSPEFIFEALLFPARLKKDEMEFCIEKLIEVLKDFETNGVEVTIEGKMTKIFIVVSRILGDNLALNEILGFSLSFNAIKYCRLCTMTRDMTRQNMIPSNNELRSIEQYEKDILENEISKTGIHKKCHFNNLKNFHCTENMVCDIMHDLYEGIIKNDLALLFKILIEDKNTPIDLEILNSIKQNFDYGILEIGNLSIPITEKHLKNKSLKMSASEMRTFIFFVPLMFGHLMDKNNEYWQMILMLVDISDIVMSSSFDEISKEKLEKSIHSYTSKYVQLFGYTLKPKHHFLQHYLQCIEINGPLR